MQYYRLWIYACNIVLLVSAVGFVIAVAHTFFFSNDPRRYLVPGVPRAYDPTALYAYFALVLQLGLVQLLGCIAARCLSAKLLNAYWLLLLALLFGDIIIGISWILRFERICADFRPNLRFRLQVEYTKDLQFSEQWDQLQQDYYCCGVTGPLDFGSHWPFSCCPDFESSSSKKIDSEFPFIERINNNNINDTSSTLLTDEACPNPHKLGCENQLMHWLKKTADQLFVLGFCVIAFTKLCFIGILRYEIREMIQKIRLLKEPPPSSTPFIQSLCPQQQIPLEHQLCSISLSNGNICRRTTLPIVTSNTSNGSMLQFVQEDDCITNRLPLVSNLPDTTVDSDTNSHCALILEETTSPIQNNLQLSQQQRQEYKLVSNSNIFEMREFHKRSFFHNIKPSNKSTVTTTANSFSTTSKRI